MYLLLSKSCEESILEMPVHPYMHVCFAFQRLFFLNGEQDLSSFLLVDMGRVKYPEYKCNRKMPVFATREALLEYEKVQMGLISP